MKATFLWRVGRARAEGGGAVRGEVHRQEAAAGLEDTPYLGELRALEVIGQVVQHEAAGHEVERRSRERDRLDQGDLEVDSGGATPSRGGISGPTRQPRLSSSWLTYHLLRPATSSLWTSRSRRLASLVAHCPPGR
jgi:hypothetical protein